MRAKRPALAGGLGSGLTGSGFAPQAARRTTPAHARPRGILAPRDRSYTDARNPPERTEIPSGFRLRYPGATMREKLLLGFVVLGALTLASAAAGDDKKLTFRSEDPEAPKSYIDLIAK